MSNRFVPHKQEEEILVKITKREAVLIQKIRKHPYGRFIVHKSDNKIIRVESTNSEIIEPDTQVEL